MALAPYADLTCKVQKSLRRSILYTYGLWICFSLGLLIITLESGCAQGIKDNPANQKAASQSAQPTPPNKANQATKTTAGKTNPNGQGSSSSGGSGTAVYKDSYSLISTSYITISLETPSDNSTGIAPNYVLLNGTLYTFHVTTNSSLPITLSVKNGKAKVDTLKGGDGAFTFNVTPTQAGALILEASERPETKNKNGANLTSAPAPPVDIILNIAKDSDDKESLSVCNVLFPSPTIELPNIDAADLINLIGDTTPFQLKDVGKNTIFIYQSKPAGVSKKGNMTIEELKEKLSSIQRAVPADAITPTPFTVEIPIRHANALGDLSTRLGSINPGIFTVADVGSDTIRVTSLAQPDCKTWRGFLSDIRSVEFGISPETPVARLSYLSASDVSGAFGSGTAGANSGSTGKENSTQQSQSGSADGSGKSGTGTANGSSGGGSDGGKGQTGKSGSKSGASGTTGKQNSPSSSPNEAKDSTGAGDGNATSTTTVTIETGKTTVSSSNNGGSTTGGSKSGSPAPTTSDAGTQQPADGPSPVTSNKSALSTAPLGLDTLLFTDANPGDDSVLREKKRILAQLDLPRPEMIVNAWIMQSSTSKPAIAGQATSLARQIVNQNNDALQRTILQGFEYIKKQIAANNYFDPDFYNYINLGSRHIGWRGAVREFIVQFSVKQLPPCFIDDLFRFWPRYIFRDQPIADRFAGLNRCSCLFELTRLLMLDLAFNSGSLGSPYQLTRGEFAFAGEEKIFRRSLKASEQMTEVGLTTVELMSDLTNRETGPLD